MKRLLAVGVVLAAAFVGMPRAQAANNFILNCGSNPAATITVSGTFALKHDATDCNSTTLIRVSASNVVLDLNDHTIDGIDGTCTKGVLIQGTPSTVAVKNGKISDCDNGVDMTGATASTVKAVKITSTESTGIVAGGNTVKHCKIIGAHGNGISGGNNPTITDNVIKHVDDSGANGTGGTYIGNVIDDASNGISTGIAAGVVKQNKITHTFDDGIVGGGSGGTYDDNTLAHIGASGIRAAGGEINDNTITNWGGIGIDTVTGHVEGNTLDTGNDTGIRFGDNGDILHNTVTHSAGAGIAGEDQMSNLLSQIVVLHNTSNNNTGDGIVFLDTIDAGMAGIQKNTTNGNGQQGIDLFDNVVPTNNDGSNHAKNNAIDPQCDGGLCG